MVRSVVVAMLIWFSLSTLAYAGPSAGDVWVEPNSGIEFVYIPKGCFNMGSRQEKTLIMDDLPMHRVCFKQGFYLSRYEITEGQYNLVMNTFSVHAMDIGDNHPAGAIRSIEWSEANTFIKVLREKTGFNFSLPSESQWEYACRAGRDNDAYCGGNDLDAVAWSDNRTHPVGQKRPNAWGLYDMSGNVMEWVQDCHTSNYDNAPTDGSAVNDNRCDKKKHRVLRGGSAFSTFAFAPNFRETYSDSHFLGFRIARSLP